MSARADHRVSRSRSRSPGYTRRHSRSRSRSGSPYQSRGGQSGYGGGGAGPSRSRRRDHSRSPMSNRRRHVGSRDAPESSNCLGVFGLSLYTTERELDKEFSKFGPLQKVQVVLDGKVSIFFAEKNNQNFLYLMIILSLTSLNYVKISNC